MAGAHTGGMRFTLLLPARGLVAFATEPRQPLATTNILSGFFSRHQDASVTKIYVRGTTTKSRLQFFSTPPRLPKFVHCTATFAKVVDARERGLSRYRRCGRPQTMLLLEAPCIVRWPTAMHALCTRRSLRAAARLISTDTIQAEPTRRCTAEQCRGLSCANQPA
jgi:hypothetical protein